VFVTHDGEEPRLQVRSGLEALDVVDSAHQRFLDEIVRTYAVAAQ